MAKVKPGIFGPISGTVGEFVYRIRNGDQVKYRRPVNQKISNSTKAVTARKRFAMNVNFSKFVNSFSGLKLIWKRAKIKASNPYQKIIKSNLMFTKKRGISVRNIITPPGIALTVEEVSINGDEISFTIPINSSELTDLLNKLTIGQIILYFYEPKDEYVENYKLHSSSFQLHEKSANGIYKMQLPIEEKIKNNLGEYNKVILYFALYNSTPIPKKIYWSSTNAQEIKI